MTRHQWPRIAPAAAALWVFLIPLATGLQAADGPDLARERRLVEQIEDAVIDGETLRLDANGQAFFAIYTETDTRQPMREPYVLDRIRGPVLDIYGGEDYPAVLRTAEERLALIAKAGNPLSAQLSVAQADHYFKDAGEPLTESVAAWLQTLVSMEP